MAFHNMKCTNMVHDKLRSHVKACIVFPICDVVCVNPWDFANHLHILKLTPFRGLFFQMVVYEASIWYWLSNVLCLHYILVVMTCVKPDTCKNNRFVVVNEYELKHTDFSNIKLCYIFLFTRQLSQWLANTRRKTNKTQMPKTAHVFMSVPWPIRSSSTVEYTTPFAQSQLLNNVDNAPAQIVLNRMWHDIWRMMATRRWLTYETNKLLMFKKSQDQPHMFISAKRHESTAIMRWDTS